ncbi:MAG: hypothetical protein A2289_08695 [Deltaproteobacteria bacterium RIFOXYA12_FULL_58_15]|nr:MAG: hypothetical protein A2289_08695 [Deltaproteobacteria bacterium RIFOXYA12_FULL_58_15]OGR09342.1 MAG: hypothetical protein A2341_15905 [Deltaproteobacteria bacterium RIFOXYB12_FULL_58_9]
MPYLVFCPREFDFPRNNLENIFYAGSNIQTQRNEPAFPWDRLCAERRLIYCSFGTQVGRVPWACRFFQQVCAAVTTRKDWQLVVHAGDFCVQLKEIVPSESRVTIVRTAPQLSLLARADAAVIHGGLGTVKECIWHGVPMLVAPTGHDQPGNAARVVYHGLGTTIEGRRATAAQIQEALAAMLENTLHSMQLAYFSKRFRENPGMTTAADLLETWFEDRQAKRTGG